jgi:hypothetical protein
MRSVLGPTFALGMVLGLSQTAQAAEVTRVATAFEEKNKFDFHFGVVYDFNFKKAAILREWNTGAADDSENRLVKDLIFQQQRHIITPNLEFGFWHDFAFYAALPIIAHDQTVYGFDQRSDDCKFGADAAFPDVNCVNKDNSTTVRDGILPHNGFDATSTSNPFGQFTGTDTERIFNGPVRRGLDQLNLGLKFGIMNQTRHSHLPNWVVGLEGRFAIGRAQTMSRNIEVSDPQGNHRVGQRIHELGVWTALSRRYRFLDPFFTAYWRYAMRANGSEFQDLGKFGPQDRIQPMSTVGVTFGTEIVPWERKAKQQKVAILVRGTAQLRYGGRGYSEMWQILADSPALTGKENPGSGDACDPGAASAFAAANPGDTDGYLAAGGPGCKKFNGITDIQNYGTFGADTALVFHMGQYARMLLGANMMTDTRHFLTFTDRGDDKNGNDMVDPNTTEVNPVRRDVVDNVGRRYMIDDVLNIFGYASFLLTF